MVSAIHWHESALGQGGDGQFHRPLGRKCVSESLALRDTLRGLATRKIRSLWYTYIPINEMLNDDFLDNRYIVLLPVASFWIIVNSIFLETIFAVSRDKRNFFILVIIIAMTFKYSLTWMRHYLKYMLPPVYKNATCNALSVRILMYFSHKRNLDGQSFYFLIKSLLW